MAINMVCMNSKCKYYWADYCLKNIEETQIIIDKFGKCQTFEEGKSDWYNHKFNEDMKMYICIKGFSIEKCADEGFMVHGDYMLVEEGSVWFTPERKDYRVSGGEIRLESDDLGWIEGPKEMLEEYFEIII